MHSQIPTNKWMCLLSVLMTALLLSGCRTQAVEKLCTLPDRETQLVTKAENENRTRAWDLLSLEEITLSLDHAYYSTHFYNNSLRTEEIISPDPAEDSDKSQTPPLQYNVMELSSSDTKLLHSFTVPSAYHHYLSHDDSMVLYDVLEDNQLCLYLLDTKSGVSELIWQSPDLSELLSFEVEVHLFCQWAENDASFFFMPILVAPYDIEDHVDYNADINAANGKIETESIASYLADLLSDSSYAEWSYLYTYQVEQSTLISHYLPDALPLYYPGMEPLAASNEDGTKFFIFFNSPQNPDLAYSIDLENDLQYSFFLTDYYFEFSSLEAQPVFYQGILYLYLPGTGILALDLASGQTLSLYHFNDPIQAFVICEDTLIVAQASDSSSVGVDITAYLLEDTQNSVLLYHTENADPYIWQMSVNETEEGITLLLEILTNDLSGEYRKLILLNF